MVTWDPLVLAPAPQVRRPILKTLEAALAAVDPAAAIRRVVRRDGPTLWIQDRPYRLDRFRRLLLLGAGKAGAPMAQALVEVLSSGDPASIGLPLEGLVVVKVGHGLSETALLTSPPQRTLSGAPGVQLVEAAHPLPDDASLAAGASILTYASLASLQDLVLVLLSGGASALMEALPATISLDALRQTTDLLLGAGASINEVNGIRKHLSHLKGGQLRRAAASATMVTLVLSDVVGSPLGTIASGPTVPDPTTWAMAWETILRYNLAAKLPASVRAHLEAGVAGHLPETPKPGDPLFDGQQVVVIGDNALAAAAAAEAARQQGWNAQVLTTFLEGEAREVARVAVALAREVQRHHRPIAPPPACLILGGETTVTLGREQGQGGRNQELALAAALALEGHPGITLAALATDGSDGPTDAAGGLVDSGTVVRARAAGFDPWHHLATHDALPLLHATHDLLRTGPTRTNVNDLLCLWIEADQNE